MLPSERFRTTKTHCGSPGCPRGFGFAFGLKDNRLTFEPVTKPVNLMSPSSAALHPSPASGRGRTPRWRFALPQSIVKETEKSAPLVVALPWRVAARCPIVDSDLAPGRSAIPVLFAALVLTVRRPLRL